MEALKFQKFSVKFSKFYLLKSSNNMAKRRYGKAQQCPKKAAIVLSGSGHLDGSCMYEAISSAICLYRCNITPEFYAPKVLQSDVINHLTGCPEKGSRCVLNESARIARGKVQNLCELRYCDYSCIIFPGGFGVTKTLTSFEEERSNCSINPDVMKVMEEFHDSRKPMAFICIAAILPARLFPLVKITLGRKGKKDLWPYQFAIDCACVMGAELEEREVDDYSFDKQHMVFTTPAFMYNGNCAEVFNGISNMIFNLAKYTE